MKRRDFMKNAAIVGASAKFTQITEKGRNNTMLKESKASNPKHNNNASKAKNISEQAARLHEEALVWDMTLPWRLAESINITSLHLKYGCLDRYISSGANLISLTIAADESGTEASLNAIGAERTYFLKNSDKYVLVNTSDDILRAKKEGKLAICFHFQGTVPVGRNLGNIEVFHKLGIRHMLMAYNQKNFVGDGCHERTDSGLSVFGVNLVKEMNRVGMLVDCAHSGYITTMDVLEVSTAPVIFSHTNAKGVFDHPRCIRDDQIIACAKSGGVMGMTGLSIFLGKGDDPVEAIIRHIDYIANLVGPQHVGLGLDYVYDMKSLQYVAQLNADKWPKSGGYTNPDIKQVAPEDLPRITDSLLKKGFTDPEVKGILGENFLRVFKDVCG
jgi:membrane dipeptidase